MKTTKYILALGAFFVVALAISACGNSTTKTAKPKTTNVVEVGGNPITLTAYKHWMFVAAKGNASQSQGGPVIVPTDPPQFTGCIAQVRKQIPSLAKTPDAQIKTDCKTLFTSLNATVMDFLIKAYWYQAEAYRLHITFTPAQIETKFNQAKSQQFKTPAAFTAFLKETGQTLADIKFRVLINAIYTKLEAMHAISTTPAAIEAYYKSHTSQFGTPETRDIRIVRTKTKAAAEAAKTALTAKKHAESWTVVAKKYSIDTATKSHGGLLSGVTNGEEETALNKAAFAAPAGKIEGVIHGTFGYYTFEVIKINKATTQSLAKATPLIKEELTSQNQTAETNAVNAAAKAHWFSKTICMAAYSMADCFGYKPPAPTATTPTTGATGATGATTVPATTAPSTGATGTTVPATTAPASTSAAPSSTTATAPASTATAPAATTATTTAPASTAPASTGTTATTTPASTSTTTG